MPDRQLSRALLAAGGLDELVAREAPALRLLTDAERRRSLDQALAARPPGDAWLFAYGSLIWNPTVHVVERRNARVEGWHRTFCLSTIAGRGTKDRPGLMLGLDEGGSCQGIAYRLAEEGLEGELELLWRREMLAAAYIPRWIDLLDEDGRRFGGAIAFTIDRTGDHYAGGLADEMVVERLATATGSLGRAADYLFQTRDGLRACGMPDAELERLAAAVEAFQASA
ncbi:gamma-glutamylcyclotransferase [Allostella humosa]|nr:gamma-glutamylcyclotransferase [Stella humosa]